MTSFSGQLQGTKYVTDIANAQKAAYRNQAADLISHYSHEHSIADAYRGRQILELLQNADDAGEEFGGPRRVLFRLTDSHLIAANTGHSFSQKGVRSLVVSDVSPKRLSRQRHIGNKGLGFRSILTWSPAPLIMSGVFRVAFDLSHAREVAWKFLLNWKKWLAKQSSSVVTSKLCPPRAGSTDCHDPPFPWFIR